MKINIILREEDTSASMKEWSFYTLQAHEINQKKSYRSLFITNSQSLKPYFTKKVALSTKKSAKPSKHI